MSATNSAVPTSNQTDRDGVLCGLISRIAEEDESALAELYRLVESNVYAFALSRIGDQHLAMDALSETMLAIWRSAERFAGNSKAMTWILGIARNKAIDQIRRRGAPAEEVDDDAVVDDAPNADDVMAAVQDADHVQLCMDGLPPTQREAIFLAFYEDMEYSEIAEMMGCAVNTVKTRVFRAKEALKKCLQQLFSPL